LYSAFLAVHLDLRTLVPSIAQATWESEGDVRGDALAGSSRGCVSTCECGGSSPAIRMGIPRAGARLPRSLASNAQELCSPRGSREAGARWPEPLRLSQGSLRWSAYTLGDRKGCPYASVMLMRRMLYGVGGPCLLAASCR
jgi:hypothetical protein